MSAALLPCSECATDVDPNDAAPSCGAHVVCLGCYQWGNVVCHDCNDVWRDIAEDREADRADGVLRDGRES